MPTWYKMSVRLIQHVCTSIGIPWNILRIFVLCEMATILLMSVGYNFAWPSVSLAKIKAEDSSLKLTANQGSWAISLQVFGAIFGPIMATAIVDKVGRKISLLLTAVPLLISALLIVIARTYIYLYIARIIAGFGIGATFSIMPMYIGEIADADMRGRLGSLIMINLNVGILLIYYVGPWLKYVPLALVGCGIPTIFLLSFAWMPESPYYYIMKNNSKAAEESLIWLTRKNDVSQELEIIKRDVELDNMNKGTLKELFTGSGNQKALIIILGLISAQQLSGLNAMVSYYRLIFEEAHTGLNTDLSVVIVGVFQIVASIVAILLVDKAGRKPLLLMSTIFTTVCLSGLALYFQKISAMFFDTTTNSWLPLVFIIGYVLSHGIGLTALPYIILSEIFPSNVKAFATMTVSIYAAILGMIVTKLYQTTADAYGVESVFWIFASFTFASIIFIYFVLPETKGRSLRDIQEELINREMVQSHL